MIRRIEENKLIKEDKDFEDEVNKDVNHFFNGDYELALKSFISPYDIYMRWLKFLKK
jgi:hypothetical protein